MDNYLRIVIAHVVAFICSVLASNLIAALVPNTGLTIFGSLVVSAYTGFILIPFILLDALFIRPGLPARLNQLYLFVAELFGLLLYRYAIQWRGLAAGSQHDQLFLAERVLVETTIFLLIYVLLSAEFRRLFEKDAGHSPRDEQPGR